MNKQKYNGWTNRSTWLVEVHMQNTDKDIANMYHEIAVQADTKKQFKSRVTNLLIKTKIYTEDGFNLAEVNWTELWDANRLTS